MPAKVHAPIFRRLRRDMPFVIMPGDAIYLHIASGQKHTQAHCKMQVVILVCGWE